jgi:hypothetical protein
MQTQIINRKKGSMTSGNTSKNKKFIPGQAPDTFGLQASLNALASTYSAAATSGKIGSRKLSTQSR